MSLRWASAPVPRFASGIALVLSLSATVAWSGAIQERLRQRVEASAAGDSLTVGAERVHCVATLREFYEKRSFSAAWSREGKPLRQVSALVSAVRNADAEGLRPNDYHLVAIQKLLSESSRFGASDARGDRAAVELDLLSTDAFLLLASHSLAGHLDPETVDPEWRARRREANLAAVLEQALAEDRVREALEGLLPPQVGYAALRSALAGYRSMAAGGGWPQVPEGSTLRAGDTGPRVEALAARLRVTNDLVVESPGSPRDLFDEALEGAVRGFQARHGLDADGVVGPATLTALNVTAEARVRQIVVNLERWRWLPQDMGRRHIIVNVAAFHLDVVDSGEPLLVMKVIVGRDYRRTPVFSDSMTYLVLSPSWEVPPKLAATDILSQIKKDPQYLSRMGFKVLRGWGSDERDIDPASIDWSRVQSGSFPYRLRQLPGPKNALGHIKFMFPNKFNVYLHDTPSRELFAKADRAFSSGCIRIEKPIELAELLLSDQPGWDRARILETIHRGREQTVRLSRPVPVHLLYWTAWVEGDGRVHFRKDVYGRDRRVDDALRELPPGRGVEP